MSTRIDNLKTELAREFQMQLRERRLIDITECYPDAFRERVINACKMFDKKHTPRDIRNKHGKVVLDKAIEITAVLNGFTGDHYKPDTLDPSEYSYPILKRKENIYSTPGYYQNRDNRKRETRA
jgi:hypothetical protein